MWYLSGPITIATRKQQRLFYFIEELLDGLDMECINPMNHPKPKERKLTTQQTWEHYMRHSIRDLMDCDGIILLPGWQDSKGACLEKELAERLNMEIVTWDTYSKYLYALELNNTDEH